MHSVPYCTAPQGRSHEGGGEAIAPIKIYFSSPPKKKQFYLVLLYFLLEQFYKNTRLIFAQNLRTN